VQVYVPLCTEPITHPGQKALDSRSNWFLQIVGRPKPGLTPAQVEAHLAMLSPGLIEATLPQNGSAEAVAFYRKAKFTVAPADKGFSALRTTFRKALYVLMAVVAMVLLIACANVANLLLARATTRQREIAVRLALGAGRGRLVRQLLTESILLSFIGAALGVAFAAWGSRLLVAMMSTTRGSLMLDLAIDRSMLAFTVLVATTTGLLFGLAPAWRIGGVDPHAAMKSHGRGVAEGHSRFSMGKALVVAQIALSLVLIAGAGLLLGSWRRLANTDPGFAADQVLIVKTDVQAAVASNEEAGVLYRQVLDRLRALPGVRGASLSQIVPIGTSSWNDAFKTDGFVPASRADKLVWMNEVSDGYFAAMGTPLIAGRDFGSDDVPGSAAVAIINEAMARRAFGSASPIGKEFRLERGKEYGPPIRIIGVVANAKYRSLRAADEATAYLASSQNTKPSMGVYFEVRTEGATAAAIASIRAVFAEVSPRTSIEFTPMRRQVSESLRLPRTLATLSGFFGALALLLATIGLYGIMSYSIARRRNEIGVRIALGAARSRVIRMVVGEVGRMVVVGVAIGTLLTLAVTRLVATFLYGVKPNDPATMAASAIVLALVAIGAAMLPAWRASRLDPVAALRED
jgi:predicted permease